MYRVKTDDFGYGVQDDFSFYGPEFPTIQKAMDFCQKIHDNGDEDDMMIVNLENGNVEAYIRPYDLDKQTCPVCGKEVRHMDMEETQDCHGIPYRMVCPRCWKQIMGKGYDGVYYDESDECFD